MLLSVSLSMRGDDAGNAFGRSLAQTPAKFLTRLLCTQLGRRLHDDPTVEVKLLVRLLLVGSLCHAERPEAPDVAEEVAIVELCSTKEVACLDPNELSPAADLLRRFFRVPPIAQLATLTDPSHTPSGLESKGDALVAKLDKLLGSGGRLTFSSDEVTLSEWMAANTFVTWFVTEEPWTAEHEIIRVVDLPLNLDQNSHHVFHAYLSEARRLQRERARRLPVLPR